MARLTAAMLCDFAQVRENLLFVSSAGISRLYHPSAPVRPNLFVAGIVEVGPAEFDQTHELRVRVRSPELANEVGEAVIAMQPTEVSPGMKPGEAATLPFALPLAALELPSFGPYDISVSVDDEPSVLLTLYVEQLPTAIEH